MIKIDKESFSLFLKGFAMGTADIIPGVSGGTIAFITGIYGKLLESVANVNGEVLKNLFQFKIKKVYEQMNGNFLLPLGFGIFTALISTAKLAHFLLSNYPIYTWSLFLGLIGGSIYYVGKDIENIKNPKNILSIIFGSVVAYLVVSMIPVQTPEGLWFIFISGFIAITAMILPGISGSFLLVILGKYMYITGALKSPFADGSLLIIFSFMGGAVLSLISVSKILNWIMKNYQNTAMAVLTGFMIGSMKKIWPWKKTLESVVIRGKTHVLREQNILPESFNTETMIAIGLMIVGLILVIQLEKLANKRAN